MAKLTREQLTKWNAKAHNGFRLDIEYFLTWNEKTLIKDILLPEGDIIRFKLYYIPEYETITNSYGCIWNQRTGRQIPTMRVDKLVKGKTEGIYIVHTLEHDITMGDPEKTLKFAALCNISASVNTDKYMEKFA